MPTGVPAHVAFVCALMFGVTIAHAQEPAPRRPVAVIDLSGDAATAKLARDLNPILQTHPELKPIEDPTIPPELLGEFRDDDQRLILDANNAKQAAETALAKFSFDAANNSGINGQTGLESVVPTSKAAADPKSKTPQISVIALHSQLSFIRGLALLGMPGRAADARWQFALAHRLDPTFAPDAARYLPDVVQAFDAAKKAWTGKGTLVVVGHGRLWIDGKDAGTAPADVEVDAGPHVVWLTGADRVTSAKQVTVNTGKKDKLEIADAPADTRLKVRRARAELRYADPTVRVVAMKTLANLVGVKDAVLLSSANNIILVQTWTAEGTSDFSSIREMGKKEMPADLLKPLEGPKKETPIVVQPPKKKPEPPKKWYERRPIQVSIVVGALAAIIGGYYIIKAVTDDDFNLDNDIGPAARIRF